MQKSKRTKNQHQKRLKTSFLDAARTNNLIFRCPPKLDFGRFCYFF
jgi:hypothetical protein